MMSKQPNKGPNPGLVIVRVLIYDWVTCNSLAGFWSNGMRDQSILPHWWWWDHRVKQTRKIPFSSSLIKCPVHIFKMSSENCRYSSERWESPFCLKWFCRVTFEPVLLFSLLLTSELLRTRPAGDVYDGLGHNTPANRTESPALLTSWKKPAK